MRKNTVLITILLFTFYISIADNSTDLKLWYQTPAVKWSDALPLGNGRLGAMVYGIPDKERIQINEETIWAGGPHNNVNYNAKGALGEIRKALFENRRTDAQNLCDKNIYLPGANGMPYQTAGELQLDFDGSLGQYSDYYRELDIERAIATTTFSSSNVIYRREILTSFKYQVIAMHLTASKAASISFKASYSLPYPDGQVFNSKAYSINDNSSIMQISCKNDDYEGIEGKVKFTNCTLFKTYGGETKIDGNNIVINGADSVTIYLSIGTNFISWNNVTGDADEVAYKPLKTFEHSDIKWDKFKQNNIEYYQKQFKTVSLNLGTTSQIQKPTNVRISEFASNNDPQFVELFFQFGRYLLICCSQPGCQPSNLQGIWNDSRNPVWDSKFTTNINFEMNYWPAFVCGLSNCFQPFVKFVDNCSIHGKQSGEMYGCRGWTVHHNTDIWVETGVIDGAYYGMWPTGAAWLCNQLWDGYQFTKDLKYLKEIYPILKSACQFFIDFLVEEPVSGKNYLVIAPSYSPENEPHKDKDNKGVSTSFGVTMDNQMLSEFFKGAIEAASIMKDDNKFIDSLKNIRSRLMPMKIGSWGQLQEWYHDWDDKYDNHRHVSHLWGMYPGQMFSADKTPELFNAVKTSLLARGDESTGWSMGWKVCLWARLLDGDHAYKLIKHQLEPIEEKATHGGVYNNLFDAHPPFQIDGNFGCTAGIAEMLVQSHTGKIVLLPAIPSHWENGSVKGLHARGGFIIEELTWKDKKPVTVKIKSTIGGEMNVAFDNKLKTIKTVKGKTYNLEF